MIVVKMQVAEGVDEVAALEPADLRDHAGKQRVGSDVEGHAEEKIGAALVKLAAQLAVDDEELEKRVAGRQRHLVDLGGIPRRDDVPAAVGLFLDLLDDLGDLVDRCAVQRAPVAPLRAVDAAEIAVLVGPFVPDGNAALLQPADVGFSAQKPEQLVDKRLEMDLLGCDEREGLAKRVARLRAEDGERARAGAVGLGPALLKDEPEKI